MTLRQSSRATGGKVLSKYSCHGGNSCSDFSRLFSRKENLKITLNQTGMTRIQCPLWRTDTLFFQPAPSTNDTSRNLYYRFEEARYLSVTILE